jgi:hypothetical protein
MISQQHNSLLQTHPRTHTHTPTHIHACNPVTCPPVSSTASAPRPRTTLAHAACSLSTTTPPRVCLEHQHPTAAQDTQLSAGHRRNHTAQHTHAAHLRRAGKEGAAAHARAGGLQPRRARAAHRRAGQQARPAAAEAQGPDQKDAAGASAGVAEAARAHGATCVCLLCAQTHCVVGAGVCALCVRGTAPHAAASTARCSGCMCVASCACTHLLAPALHMQAATRAVHPTHTNRSCGRRRCTRASERRSTTSSSTWSRRASQWKACRSVGGCPAVC